MTSKSAFINGLVKGMQAPFDAFTPAKENRGLNALKVYKPAQRRSACNDLANIRRDFQYAIGVINAEVASTK